MHAHNWRGTRRGVHLWYQETVATPNLFRCRDSARSTSLVSRKNTGIKKAPPGWGLLGRQRAGNHPSPCSVNKLGCEHKDDEGVVNPKPDQSANGERSYYQDPSHDGDEEIIKLVFIHNVFPLNR